MLFSSLIIKLSLLAVAYSKGSHYCIINTFVTFQSLYFDRVQRQ